MLDNTETETPTSTQEIQIQGIMFTIPMPYAEGHVISAAEAAALNQTYAENIRNNFAKSVKDAAEVHGEDLDSAVLQEQLDAYAAEYKFQGRRRSTAVTVDPITREAQKIAKQMIVEGLQKKGLKIKDLPDGKMEEYIETLLGKNPGIREEAVRRVAVASEASADIFASLEDSI